MVWEPKIEELERRKKMFEKMGGEAGAQCTECEECLEKSPYNLEIPELIKENIAVIRDFMDQHA